MRLAVSCMVVVLMLLVSPRVGLSQDAFPLAWGVEPQQLVEFSFTHSEIKEVLQHVIRLTGWSIFYDPTHVQGNVTILTPGKIPLTQAIRLLQGAVGPFGQAIQVLVPGSQQAVPLAMLATEPYLPHERRDAVVWRNSNARGPQSRPYACNQAYTTYPALPYGLEVIVGTTR